MNKIRFLRCQLFLFLIVIFPVTAIASETYDSKGNVIPVDVSGSAYELYERIIDKKNKIAYQNQARIRGEKVSGFEHPFWLLHKIEKLNERLEEMAINGDSSAQIYFADIKLQEARHRKSQYEELKGDAILSKILYKAMTEAYDKALKWLKVAANSQDTQSALELGKIYQNGDGVNKSNLAAIEWYYKYSIYSQKEGNRESALHGLELILSLSPNHPLARKLSDSLYGKEVNEIRLK